MCRTTDQRRGRCSCRGSTGRPGTSCPQCCGGAARATAVTLGGVQPGYRISVLIVPHLLLLLFSVVLKKVPATSVSRGPSLQLACCAVLHFSWFMVVSRPVTDRCSLTAAQSLLVSTADPGVKLCFPPNSTLHPRTVTLQVARRFSLSQCFSPFHPAVCMIGTSCFGSRCWRCPSRRCRLCAETPRPESAPSSASRRLPAPTSCGQSEFRSPYHRESQVSHLKCLRSGWPWSDVAFHTRAAARSGLTELSLQQRINPMILNLKKIFRLELAWSVLSSYKQTGGYLIVVQKRSRLY